MIKKIPVSFIWSAQIADLEGWTLKSHWKKKQGNGTKNLEDYLENKYVTNYTQNLKFDALYHYK